MKPFCAAILVAGLLSASVSLAADVQTAADGGVIAGQYRGTVPVAHFDVSPKLSSIAPIPVYSGPIRPGREREESPSGLEWLNVPQRPDAIAQAWKGSPLAMPGPIVSFNAQPNISGVNPPDPVGDVGPDHYVAMSNSSLQIFDKSGNSLLGPQNINTLWSGFGGACQNENSGDPVVLYDQFADRWLITQFTSAGPTYYNCVAISTSGDPTGTYYRYAFTTGLNFPDYPKYGVWRDAYYISTREFLPAGPFAGIGGYALKRDEMIAGNPNPTVISIVVPPGASPFNTGDGLLPADIDGATLPPDGSPEYFMGTMDAGGPYSAPQDALTLWKFHADFVTPANSTFLLASTIPIAEFDTIYPCGGGRACLPQLDTTTKIDIQSYRQRMLNRLAYRNFGSHESLVSNQSVEAAASIAGIRWWEVRNPAGTPIVYQEGTYAPGITDGVHRWMGSAAMDSAGNMALGFSATSATMYPSIRYTGRLSNDPPGTMPRGEGVIVSGTGSNTSTNSRWGDYTSLNVDPTDDCTFWYVNQYTPVTSSSGWNLRVGAFRFDECGTPGFRLTPQPASQSVCVGAPVNINVAVSSINLYDNPVTLSTTGAPVGATESLIPNPVTPLPGTSALTYTNTAGVSPGVYPITINGSAAGPVNESVIAEVNFQIPLSTGPDLSAPANAAVNQPIQPTLSWAADSGADQYTVEVATDSNFNNIVDSATVSTTSWQVGIALLGNTTYYWRVRSLNACGSGANSNVRSFTTINSYCYVGPLNIPDNNPTGVNATITIPSGQIAVSAAHVSVDLTHTYVGDLVLTLSHGAATADIISQPPSCSTDDIHALFYDAASGSPNTCAGGPAISGEHRPNQPFVVFDALSYDGIWTLNASDRAGADVGTLDRWCIDLPAQTPDLIFADGFEATP
jgi:subtilisin-like proprotein convertase family protein